MPTTSPRGTVPGAHISTPRLRSPLARAVVPVAGGIAVIALILLATWAIAAFIARGGAESTERLAPPTFEVGPIEPLAETIADEGPLILPGLDTTSAARTLVLDHEGADPARGWRVYWAYPASGEPTCPVEQDRGTSTFVDCEGRALDVTELARPEGVRPIVENRRTLILDLRDAAGTTP